MEEDISVGIGEIAVTHNPKSLKAIGLGSCVGIALYDKENHIGALAHVMLPSSKEFAGKISKDRNLKNLTRYADIAIPQIINDMIKLGAKKNNIKSKIAGGAQMFPGLKTEMANIGNRNVDAVKIILKEQNIPIEAEDVGGNSGRSITLDTITQKLKIKTIKGEMEI